MLDGVAEGPAPAIHPENSGFWESVAAGSFKLQRCSDCGTIRFPIAPCCWKCLSFDSEWVDAQGDGRVAVASRVVRATGNPIWQDAVPLLSGLVDTDAGIRIPGRIICTCGEATKHGTPVQMVALPAKGGARVYGFEHACGTEGQ